MSQHILRMHQDWLRDFHRSLAAIIVGASSCPTCGTGQYEQLPLHPRKDDVPGAPARNVSSHGNPIFSTVNSKTWGLFGSYSTVKLVAQTGWQSSVFFLGGWLRKQVWQLQAAGSQHWDQLGSVGMNIPNTWINIKCSKPPTRLAYNHLLFQPTGVYHTSHPCTPPLEKCSRETSFTVDGVLRAGPDPAGDC